MKLNAADYFGDDIKPGHECQDVWLVVAINQEGHEGIPAFMQEDMVLPMLTTDPDNLEGLRRAAQLASKADPKMKMVIRHFTKGVDIEEIHQ